MKLQLDTSVQIHKLLNRSDDPVNAGLNTLTEKAESVEASTYSKKEFAFSLIKDCCTMLARLNRKKSFRDALIFINTYGSHKIRFPGRILPVCWKFFISQTIKDKWLSYDENKRDDILAEEFARFLRLYIPVLWEEFERGLNLPLQDRTKCPFAKREPVDNGKTFEFHTKKKCNKSFMCALPNMISGEKRRALKLLEILRGLEDRDKTKELKKIESVLVSFFEKDNKQICYEMCNQGIGDLIISLETLLDRTLITTNAKESNVISPAISQEYIILPMKKSN